MICFDAKEMEGIYEATQKRLLSQELNKEITGKGYSYEEIRGNKQKMNEIADSVVARGQKDKSNIEFFIALDTCLSFYKGNDTKICFVLKNGIQPNKIKVGNLEDLRNVVKEDTLTDFAIFFSGLRQFQLKQYKGELKTEPFFNFIRNKLAGYGNDLKDVNLLIVLQGNGSNISEIEYKEIYEKISELKLKFFSEILVIYNENNKFNVINQIYPELKSMKKEFNLPSEYRDLG